MALPMMLGSALNWRFQKAWLRMMTGGPLGRDSSAVKMAAEHGLHARVWKKLSMTSSR